MNWMLYLFFFSSRRRHTRCSRDWSSDVCSSDLLAFPFILLAIGIIAVLGPSFPTLIVVIALSGWVNYARILRSQVLVLRSREFVDAIHALGGSALRVIARHILPNVLSSLVEIGRAHV